MSGSDNEQFSYEDTKNVALLELYIKSYKISQTKEERASFIVGIIEILAKCPMFLPVSIDLEAMLGNIDPTSLKPGDVISSDRDVRMKISTLGFDGNEIIPLFTSSEQVNKGPSTSVLRMYPGDYVSKIVNMGKDICINPFDGNCFYLEYKFFMDIIVPIIIQLNSKEEVDTNSSLIGSTLENKYELITQISKSSKTDIYLAKDLRLNKVWAVKILDKNNSLGADALYALKTEVELSTSLNHPAIPNIVDVIENDRYFCIVSEYVEGKSLDKIIAEFGAQPQDLVANWSIQICEVLQYLHSCDLQIIHRNIKPMSFILQPNGVIRLTDLSIARIYKPNANKDTTNLGTKGYAAPEQYGGRQTDPRTDIFGLGMTMHNLLTGIDPRLNNGPAESVCKINPNLSKGLEYIIEKCISVNPDDRYQSCSELLNDLKKL